MTKHIFTLVVLTNLGFCVPATSQVQVSKEPRHVPVVENQYIRLLDVRLRPGDTTFYHIHSTPSVFIILSETWTASQTQGEEWSRSKSAVGNIWYRSFQPDSLIHRVANIDSTVFHVNDIEILSPYRPAQYKHMPLRVMLDNEKACAYALDNSSMKKQISGRGPLIAEVVTGEAISFHASGVKPKVLTQGEHLYIPPGTTFSCTAPSKVKADIVLFEIK